ncbi:MAG: DUF885 domain-containing protein [Phycisphaerales bacterium]|nr:MAG: DUF885 domain-containing protein [Phycisphaerales bacterium]
MTTRRTPPFFAVLGAIACAALALPLGGCSWFGKDTDTQRVGAAPARSAADARLIALLDEDLEMQRRRDPISASVRGDRRFDAQLPDPSPGAERFWVQDARARHESLRRINRDDLSPEQRLNAELLAYELRMRIEAAHWRPWLTPLNQMYGPQRDLPQLADRLTFTREAHYEDYITRLEGVSSYIDKIIENMREGLREGRTPPRITLRATPDQARAHGGRRFVENPEMHAMYKPFVGRPEGDALSARAREAIARGVAPAFTRLADFLEHEYVPRAREATGASESVGGRAWYAWTLRWHTTTDLTAGEIHEIGLSEVARIRAEMMEVIARSDFAMRDSLRGDELFRAFTNHLRTNPRFYFEHEEDLLRAYRDIAKRMDAELPRLFTVLPRTPYGVRRMPDYMAPSAPTAFYYPGLLSTGTPGWFVANTYALDSRPKYEMVPLTLHEAAPGHHLQIALAQEMEDVHEWRTGLRHTAYIEGWALYAERLGLEVGDSPGVPDAPARGEPGYRGMYQDPYDDFGRLTYEMWRAMRLVVDTGLHDKGWTREQAIDYMLANSGLSRANIENEVDRYIAWPGQACAYKIGELKIRELRERAERELGADFDVRTFNDAILRDGAVPLNVLERRMVAWIEEQSRGG